jgi:hypothetical protein
VKEEREGKGRKEETTYVLSLFNLKILIKNIALGAGMWLSGTVACSRLFIIPNTNNNNN